MGIKLDNEYLKDFLLVGYCHRPHGIKGGFSFNVLSREDDLLSKGIGVLLRPVNNLSSIPIDGETFEIENISFGNKTIAYLEGVKDRNDVESMVPFIIYRDRKDFPEPNFKAGQYFISDFLELEVIDIEKDKPIGKIVSFYENGVQTIFCIAGDKELELPFVETFFKEIDFTKRIVKILVPEYING